MIADVLTAYGSEVAPHKQSARNIGYNISNLLKWWGDKFVSDISVKSCREYVKTKTAPAAGADLKVLKAAVKYWNEEYGPLDRLPLFMIPTGNPPKERWLTKSEAARLLLAAHRLGYQHMARFILLMLHTGSRPGVILSLRWDQVDLRSEILSRAKPGEVVTKKRKPKVPLGRKIMLHLKRWKKMDGGKQELVCYFTGIRHPGFREVGQPHHSWPAIVKAAGLEGRVTPHTLRHTRATWSAQAGISIWETAGFLGMTTKTLETIYAHHCPTHLRKAANI
jgi:integrase